MKRTVEVALGEEGLPVGKIHFNQQGARESATFEYDSRWLAHTERFAIDPALPLVLGPQFRQRRIEGSIFHLAIADVEPDGWGRRIIQRDHAKRRTELPAAERPRSLPLTSLDYLLAVDDTCRGGALRFRDETGSFQRVAEEGRRSTPPLIELGHLLSASRAVEQNAETAADLSYLRGRGTSLGGMRPKCNIIDDDGRLAIGKFPSVGDERSVTKGEVLAMTLAIRAGINAAEARIVDSDGASVALVYRFDRKRDGERVPYVSASTLLGAERNDENDVFYTSIVDAIRQYGYRPNADVEELWRRIAFSVLVTNVDDHLHNHGFLHIARGQWALSPAFDINPFPERIRELKTWMSEDTGPDARVDALMSLTTYFRISSIRAKEVLGDVERAVSSWREVGRSLGMSARELESFADAFEHEERAAARRAAAL